MAAAIAELALIRLDLAILYSQHSLYICLYYSECLIKVVLSHLYDADVRFILLGDGSYIEGSFLPDLSSTIF